MSVDFCPPEVSLCNGNIDSAAGRCEQQSETTLGAAPYSGAASKERLTRSIGSWQGGAVDVMAKGAVGALARRIVAVALLCTLAACGGGSSDGLSPAPLAPPPTTGTITIPAGSEILALGVGAADQIIYVMPGESTAHRIELLNADATARYDVTVTDGKEIARAVETDGRWAVVVDSQSLTANTARAYRLLVRNRTTGLVAEIYGPIKVLAPSVVGSGQISAAGGTVVVADGLGQVVFEGPSSFRVEPNTQNSWS